MKICILSFTGLDTDGRDATRILKEMRSLASAGHKVKAIGLRLREELPQHEFYYGAEIRRIKPALSFDRKLQRKLPKRGLIGSIKRLYTLTIKNALASGLALFKAGWKENADIYHCFGIYCLAPGFFLKIIKRKKAIYDAYEVPHQTVRNISSLGFFAKPLARLVGSLEIFMASRMDCILTLPSVNDVYLNRFEKHSKNVVVLRNVPPREWNGKRDTELRRQHGGKTLFYMGAFTKAKGILKMLEAFSIVRSDFPGVKLVLAGSFEEVKSFDNVKEQAIGYMQSHNLQDDVIITGHVPWQEMPTYLGTADIALHLYQPLLVFTETQGSSSLFEYMAASLPVVASDFPSIRSIVKKYNCGVAVDPTKKQEIAKAILSLLNNPELTRELGKNARKASEQEFNWGLEEKKLLQAYGELERKLKK